MLPALTDNQKSSKVIFSFMLLEMFCVVCRHSVTALKSLHTYSCYLISLAMLYSRNVDEVQEWSFTRIHSSWTSFQFSSCTGMSPGGGYRVDYSWYHFISSSSQPLSRVARISMGSWVHQLSYCLSSFSLVHMETAISCMLPVWERNQIYYLSSKKDVREFCGPKSNGCKCPFLTSLSRMQYKPVYLQKESFSAKELSSKTHCGLIRASCVL